MCRYVHYATRRNGIIYDIQVSGRQQERRADNRLIPFDTSRCVGDVKMTAALLPDLFAFGGAVAVVVIGRGTPEVGPEAKAVMKIFPTQIGRASCRERV